MKSKLTSGTWETTNQLVLKAKKHIPFQLFQPFLRSFCKIGFVGQINTSSATQFDTGHVTCSKTESLSFRCYSCKSSFQVTVDCVSWRQAVLFILSSSSPLSFALSVENGKFNVHAG